MKSGNAFANQLKALAVRKFTTTNPVKGITTMVGGSVNSLRDIWRGGRSMGLLSVTSV
jgi:hypothetical protein